MTQINEKNFFTQSVSSEKDVIGFYDKYADGWDDRFGHQNLPSTAHFLRRRLDSFFEALGPISSSASVHAVELGVGTGVYLNKLSKSFNSIIAVDGSKNMIKNLEIKLQQQKIDNVIPKISSVSSLEFIRDNSHDLVYFFGLIEHIIDVDAFINECYRVLKPGGFLVGVTPNGKSPWYQIRALIRGTGKHCSTDHYYNKKQLSSLFESHGFIWNIHCYWGLVYAGCSNRFLYRALSMLEPLLEKSFLASFLGGITFKVIKPLTSSCLNSER